MRRVTRRRGVRPVFCGGVAAAGGRSHAAPGPSSPRRRCRSIRLQDLIALAAEKRDITTKMALERDVRLVRCEDGQLEIALEARAPKTLVHDLQRKLTGWTGKRWIVVVSKEQGAPTMRAQADAQQAEIERDVQSDPLVQAVLSRFPGAKVVGVTQNGPDQAHQVEQGAGCRFR